jgi:hypothetical protein
VGVGAGVAVGVATGVIPVGVQGFPSLHVLQLEMALRTIQSASRTGASRTRCVILGIMRSLLEQKARLLKKLVYERVLLLYS